VHAFDWDWRDSRFGVGAKYVEVARELAEAVAVEALDRAREVAPDIEAGTETPAGHAVPRLIEAAEGADLLVLGSRGRGGFAGLLLGSVSHRLAAHAPCPVVVIRSRTVPDGPVAAGIDESPAAGQVLAAAFPAAAREKCGLIVVRSFAPAVPPWLADVRRTGIPAPEEKTAELGRIEEQLRPWRDKYPDVPVETVLTQQTAAAALVRGSHDTRLVVVGSRGHGEIGGTLLGSVGLQLLHHAACPVLIVREEPAP
jgi:nucleotide-binding universal stress UspA family protein